VRVWVCGEGRRGPVDRLRRFSRKLRGSTQGRNLIREVTGATRTTVTWDDDNRLTPDAEEPSMGSQLLRQVCRVYMICVGATVALCNGIIVYLHLWHRLPSAGENNVTRVLQYFAFHASFASAYAGGGLLLLLTVSGHRPPTSLVAGATASVATIVLLHHFAVPVSP
jgi:hypothetical protein